MTEQTSAQRTREKESNRTHVGPLPTKFDLSVVGVSFQPAYPGNLYELEKIHFLAEDRGEPLVMVLIREPDNPFDGNAIAVHCPALGEMGKIGHITRPLAGRLAPLLDAGQRWEAWLTQLRFDPNHPERPGIDIGARLVENKES